ncbi:MAG: phage holin family protein [Rikenellaceae bacterium]
MDQRNVIYGITASFLSGLFEFTEPLRWLFILGVVLIVADLRFGIRAARVRGEVIRSSRAIRRTINKAVDYLCWVFLSGSLGETFGESIGVNILPLLMMLVIYGVEINSCFSNYFESKGTNVRVNIFKWFMRKVDIIDIEEEKP